jgi:hypothetical protein
MKARLKGVIRIGAVNCQDEYVLCRRQGVSGYPTLYLYTLGEGTKEFEVLASLKRIPVQFQFCTVSFSKRNHFYSA